MILHTNHLLTNYALFGFLGNSKVFLSIWYFKGKQCLHVAVYGQFELFIDLT